MATYVNFAGFSGAQIEILNAGAIDGDFAVYSGNALYPASPSTVLPKVNVARMWSDESEILEGNGIYDLNSLYRYNFMRYSYELVARWKVVFDANMSNGGVLYLACKTSTAGTHANVVIDGIDVGPFDTYESPGELNKTLTLNIDGGALANGFHDLRLNISEAGGEGGNEFAWVKMWFVGNV